MIEPLTLTQAQQLKPGDKLRFIDPETIRDHPRLKDAEGTYVGHRDTGIHSPHTMLVVRVPAWDDHEQQWFYWRFTKVNQDWWDIWMRED